MAEVDLGTAQGKIVIDSSSASKNINQVGSDIDSMVHKSKGSLVALNTALVAVGTAAVGGFGFAIKTAADFEQTMSGVKAVSGATEKQMESLRKKALQLGADTSFSASESAKAMEELAKAGLNVDDILNGAADAAVNLAAAGGIDIPQAATIAANAMNQFGLSAEQMPHIADLIAGAANSSAIDVSDFGLSMQQAGAVANLVGLSFDDMAVAITAMGNAGVKGSDAGTSLKTFLTGLQPVTEKQTDLFYDLGLALEENITDLNSTGNAFFDAQGKVKPMVEIAGELEKALLGMSEQQKTATLEALFGSDAIRAAGIIAATGAEGFDTLAASMGEVSAQEVAETRLDNVKGSVEKLKGSIDTFMITAATPLLGWFKGVLDGATDFTNKLNEIDDNTKAVTLAIIGGAGALAVLVGGMGLFAHAATPVILSLKLLTSGIIANTAALLSNPWVLAAAAIAALVVGIIYAYNNFEGFRKVVDKVVDKVKEFGLAVYEWFVGTALPAIKSFAAFFMKEVLPRIQEFVDKAVEVFEKVVSFFTDTLVPGVTAAWEAVFEVVSAFVEWFDDNVVSTITAAVELIIAVFGRIVQFVRTFIVPQLEFLFNLLAPIIVAAFNVISKHIGFVLDIIKTIVNIFIDLVQKAWALFGDNILQAVVIVFGVIKTTIETVLGIIRGIIQVLTGIITLDWEKAWEGIKTIVNAVWENIKAIVDIAINAVKLVIETVVDAIKLVMSTAWDLIKGTATLAWDGIKLAITAPIELIAGIFKGVWDGIRTAASTAWDWITILASLAWGAIKVAITAPIDLIKGTLSTIWESVRTTAETAWNKIKGVIEPVVNAIVAIIERIIDVGERAIDIFKQIIGLGDSGKVGIPGVPGSGQLLPRNKYVVGAQGFIVNSATFALIGEAGPEVLVPLTDTSRALELMRMSGLDNLVLAAATGAGGVVADSVSQGGSGPSEVVHIDHASFFDSVDVQTLLTQAEFALQGGRF